MNKHILVPTDLSKNGNVAFKHAQHLSKVYSCKIKPLYIINDTNAWPSYTAGETIEEKRERVEIKLKSIITKVMADGECRDCMLEPEIIIGDIVSEIKGLSKDAQLIIMASGGKSRLSRFMNGSVTKTLLKFNTTPIIVVDEATQTRNFNKILVTTDFSTLSTKVFRYAAEFTLKTGCHIDLAHMVYTGPFQIRDDHKIILEAKEKLERLKDTYFSEYFENIETEVLLTSVSIGDAISNLINSRNYGMVFISTLGQSNIQNLLAGSVASAVIRYSDSPVFCINPLGR